MTAETEEGCSYKLLLSPFFCKWNFGRKGRAGCVLPAIGLPEGTRLPGSGPGCRDRWYQVNDPGACNREFIDPFSLSKA